MYEDQLYIQPSVQMMRKVEAAVSEAVQPGSGDMPRVRWNPYIITGLHLWSSIAQGIVVIVTIIATVVQVKKNEFVLCVHGIRHHSD